MKKIILVFAAITASLSSFAQTDSSRNPGDRELNRSTNQRQNTQEGDYQQQNNSQNQTQDANVQYQKNKDCMLVMEGGEVKQVQDGKAMVMGKKVTLENGTEVTADGMVVAKDGKVVKLKEGECVDKSGKVNMRDPAIKNEKDKNIQ